MKLLSALKKCIFFSLFMLFLGGVSGLYADDSFLYWDRPNQVINGDGRFPQTINDRGKSYVFWQEVEPGSKKIWISCRKYTSETSYVDNRRFAGPFSYSGEVPDIFSVVLSQYNGTFVLAAPTSQGVAIYTSFNNCESFVRTEIGTTEDVVAPRIYITNDGRFRLFYSLVEKTEVVQTTQTENEDGELLPIQTTVVETEFKLYYIESWDGVHWSSSKKIGTEEDYKNPFVPVAAAVGGGDLVIYQAQNSVGGLIQYQLYKTFSADNGKTWSKPTKMINTGSGVQDQRPFVFEFKGKHYMVWERTQTINTSVMFAEINQNGTVSAPMRLSNNRGKYNRGRLFEYKNEMYATWFDSSEGKIFLTKILNERGQSVLEKCETIESTTNNMFPTPLILDRDEYNTSLNFICQNTSNRICLLGPDRSVGASKLEIKSHKRNKGTERNVVFTITYPDDPSGIAGYLYTWGMDNKEIPVAEFEKVNKSLNIKVAADEDGVYNLNVIVADNAGNWSEPISISYYRDITPPSKPVINLFNIDEYGFMKDNEFTLNWFACEDLDLDGYNYEVEYLGKIPGNLVVNKTHSITISKSRVEEELNKLRDKYRKAVEKIFSLKSKILTRGLSTKKYINRENGVYRFSVSSIDDVGNVSEAASVIIFVNKYKPQTVVYSARPKSNRNGGLEAEIYGAGFTYEGTISEIYIDRDGYPPYDLILYRDKGDFKVQSDDRITNIKIGTALSAGSYRLGLLHTDRGLYFTGPGVLSLDRTGTIKYVDEYEYKPKYRPLDELYKYILAVNILLGIIIAAFIVLIIIAFSFVFTFNSKEEILIDKEINSLATGDTMPLLKTKKKEKQQSLKGKIIAFTIVLIILIVAGVTVINVRTTLTNQGSTLSESLESRIDVLLGSVNTGITSFMPDAESEDESEMNSGIQNLVGLTNQSSAVSEAKYITILGYKSQYNSDPSVVEDYTPDLDRMIYVWATNDPESDSKFINPEDLSGNQLKNGVSHVIIPETPEVNDTNELQNYNGKINEHLYEVIKKMDGLDALAKQTVSVHSEQISVLTRELMSLDFSSENDNITYESKSQSIDSERNALNLKLSNLTARNSDSLPQFSGIALGMDNTNYLFYKPVFYRDAATGKFLHALVVMEVDVSTLQQQLMGEVNRILISGVIIAIIAIILGAIGSWVLATIIVSPLKKLETHLQEVGSLLTKSPRERMRLQKKSIDIKSKDEIGRLGSVVNMMSASAGKAAEDEYLQQDGKTVQTRFIPLLETGAEGKKLPIERYAEEKLELFAFYKGDSLVSGDYFDYKKLDDRWYVFIKCDVSGHGVPAALLVSVVATKFKDFYYTSQWNFKKDGLNLTSFAYTVNDFIYNLGTRGKFVTINISLYNKETGELFTCNAGDNEIHVFDHDRRRLRTVTLANTPTAGGLSSDLIQMSGGYKVERTMLQHGDILYLYTDGIDEAERKVRDKDYVIKQVEEKNPRTGDIKYLDKIEFFGKDRVNRVVESVLNRRKFILEKEENPTREILEFDFTNCAGTIEESIIALAAVERVFRMVKHPAVRPTDEIEMETQIDDFLKEHFTLYSTYCRPAVVSETSEEDKSLTDPNVVRYSSIIEDNQADDITLIAIRRP